ncbi:putative Ig domain-containing protein [Paludibaculum fermentans]|uniref:putative Ig domain-containing protein n=1 Tax=Paludibaculum fermentans TaxID=1473598 RepID=UPI003EBB357F
MKFIAARFLLLCAMLCAAWPAVAQTRIQKVSGDGQLVLLFYSPTQPLVVQVVDGAGKPVAGKPVKWTDVGGISYASPSTTTTDANGLASLQFVAGGSFSAGVGFLSYTVTATTDIGSTSFSIVSYPFQTGAANYQPLVDFLKPLQGAPITLKAGERVADAARIVVSTSGANGGSAGLPIPGVGLSVRTLNQDPLTGPVASCTGGTVLTGADGTASCEIQASGTPGTTDLVIDVGAYRTQTIHLTMLPGDPTPTITQGNNQSGQPGQALPVQLVARILDSLNNPVAGKAVQWSVVTPGSASLTSTVSTSDVSGYVSANVLLGTTPGSFQVKLAVGTNTVLFNFVIQGTVPAFTITTASLPNGVVGGAYNQILAATGGTAPYTWSLASAGLPPGLTLNSNGTITGTITTAGSYGFTVRATDSTGLQATRSFSISTSSGLAITTTTLPAASLGAAYSLTLAATGGTPPYTWNLYSGSIVASVMPPGLSLSNTGVISGTPTAAGNYGPTVRVVDSAGHEAYQTYTFTVAAGVVISTASLPNGAVGAAYSQTLAAAGGTSPYLWTLLSGTMPPGLAVSPAGVLSGTPTVNGVFNFTLRVADAISAFSTKAFTLVISGAALNITTASLPNGTPGIQYSQNLAASGGTTPYTWSLATGTLTPGLQLTAAGAISGVPTTAGTSSFSVRVTDAAGGSATANYIITVGAALQITTASALPNGAIGTAYSTQFTVQGGTAPFTWALNSGAMPPGLMLTTAGVLSGQPTTTGNFFFSVRVSDSTGVFATAPMTLTVDAAGVAPRAGIISQVASGGGWKTTISLLNVGAATAPVKVQFMAEDGTLLDLPMTITQAGASVTQAGGPVNTTLAPNATLLIETEAPVSTTTVGWADVQGTGTLAGYAIFRQRGGDGRDSEGTSPLETKGRTAVLVTYDNSIGFATGIALVNLSTAQASITAIQRDDSGAELSRDIILLPANGHMSFAVTDRYPALAGRRGVVEFQSDQAAGITALGLRFSPTLSFTSIPVAVRP